MDVFLGYRGEKFENVVGGLELVGCPVCEDAF
jgi:hypothetical protein